VASVLQKKISSFWLLPLALIGLPFLLAATGRLFGALGAASLGEALVGWARIYGNLPLFALGLGSSDFESSVLGYVFAGLVYSGVAFLCFVVVRPDRRQEKRQ